jgi:tetratricopeptide (TPR) repeat protein
MKFLANCVVQTVLLILFCTLSKADDSCDTSVVNVIYQKAKDYKSSNLDSAELYINMGLFVADSCRNKRQVVKGKWYLANIKVQKGEWEYADSLFISLLPTAILYVDSVELNSIKVDYAYLKYRQGDYLKAIRVYDQVIPYFESQNNYRLLVQCLINMAKIKIKQNAFADAMNYFVEALKISEQNEMLDKQALIYGNMGRLYFKEQEYDKCLEVFKKSLAINEQLGKLENVAVCYQSIGTIYILKEEYVEAEKCLKKAGQFFSNVGLAAKQVTVLNNLGVLYKRLKKYNLALANYNEILAINKALKSKVVKGNALENMSVVYSELKQYDHALRNLQLAINAYTEFGENDLREAYLNMAGLYEAKGDYQNAFKWHKEYKAHSDSIFNIEKFKEVENIQAKYETEKKEILIDKMKVENEMQFESLQKTRLMTFGIAVVAFLFLTAGFLINKQSRLKIESYKALMKQSDLLMKVKSDERKRLLSADNDIIKRGEETDKRKVIPEPIKMDILERLKSLINQEKIYIDQEISVHDVAKKACTNPKYLSQVIKESFNCGFSSFINQLRIEESQRLLKASKYNEYTLEAIGQMAGFKSKSVFYASFKRLTGVTPSFYKKQLND